MALPLNLNPVSNPTHPAHQLGARHLGAAIGHLLVGNGEMAAHHLGQAFGHFVAPHMPDGGTPAQVGNTMTQNLKAAAHGKAKAPKPKPTKPAKK
jgi:hypothetical protein